MIADSLQFQITQKRLSQQQKIQRLWVFDIQ